MNALRFVGEEPGFVKLNRCDVVGHNAADSFAMSPWSAVTFEGAGPATIEATDCHFGNYYWIYDDSPGTATPDNANKTVRLINPKIGPEAMGGAIQMFTGAKGFIQGKSATEKADLRTSTVLFAFGVVSNGSLTFQDCILHNSNWNGEVVSLNAASAQAKELNIERCLLPAEGVIRTDGAAGSGVTTINITNSFIKFGENIINTNVASVENLNLTHFTFFESDGLTGKAAMLNGAEDSIRANYCIFNAADATNTFSALGLAGKLNIINHAPT